MAQPTPPRRQFPMGLVAVFLMLCACSIYAVHQHERQDLQPNAAANGEQPLFNGVMTDDPTQIHKAVAIYGRLPYALAAVAINLAASENHAAAVDELLRDGADANARTLQGRTPLIVAAGAPGNAGMMRRLLDAGADPAAAACDGDTAITEARTNKDQQEVLILTNALAGQHHSN